MQKLDPKENPIFIPNTLLQPVRALESGQGLLCSVQAFDEIVPMVLLRLTSQEFVDISEITGLTETTENG